jgi:hypothetical protein
MSRVECFEIPIVELVKVNQDGHNFAFHELASALALDLSEARAGSVSSWGQKPARNHRQSRTIQGDSSQGSSHEEKAVDFLLMRGTFPSKTDVS